MFTLYFCSFLCCLTWEFFLNSKDAGRFPWQPKFTHMEQLSVCCMLYWTMSFIKENPWILAVGKYMRYHDWKIWYNNRSAQRKGFSFKICCNLHCFSHLSLQIVPQVLMHFLISTDTNLSFSVFSSGKLYKTSWEVKRTQKFNQVY